MRVLSIIPALFLAVASFVGAAPTADSDNDASAQAIANVFTEASSQLHPLSTALTEALNANPRNVDAVNTILPQITSLVTNTVSQAQSASNGVDLSGSNLAAVGDAASAFGNSVHGILGGLVPDLEELLSEVGSDLVTLVNNLLYSVNVLTTFLQPFLVYTLEGILGPVIDLLDNVLDTVQGILEGL